MNEARYYFYNQDYAIAKVYYEQGFKKVKKNYEMDNMFYAACLFEDGEIERATDLLIINDYYTGLGLNDSHYFRGMNQKLKDSILKKNNEFIDSVVRPFVQTDLYQTIETMRKNDREIRNRYYKAERNEMPNKFLNAILDTMRIIDDDNFKFIDSISKKKGWLGGVNWRNSRHLHIFLLHASQEWFNKNEKFLYKSLKKGHIIPIDYALTIDRKKYMERDLRPYYWRWGYDENIDSLSPQEFFNRCNAIGLSPYFMDELDLIPSLGKLPPTTPFYEYYKIHKDDFNCVKSK